MTNDKLHDLKCTACSEKTPKLNNKDIDLNLKKILDWHLNEEREMIFKKYNFNNFTKALAFVNSVGKIAETESHHPDISLGWGYCLILIHTHAIKGLSLNDFILASKVDLISK